MTTKVLLFLVLIGACIGLSDPAVEQGVIAEAQLRAEASKGAFFAGLIAHCANQGSLRISTDIIDCKRRK